jgi:hypothetical protein
MLKYWASPLFLQHCASVQLGQMPPQLIQRGQPATCWYDRVFYDIYIRNEASKAASSADTVKFVTHPVRHLCFAEATEYAGASGHARNIFGGCTSQ